MVSNKYYVVMTDKGMSGWGRAEGKINKLVIECDTYEEAEIVEANARARTEMKYINILARKPYYPSSRYFVSRKSKTDYSTWFIPGAFYRSNK